MNTIDRDAVIEIIDSVAIETYSFGGQSYEDCVGTITKIIEAVRALPAQPVKCICGEPSDTNVVHRSDAPCYCKSQPAQPDPRDEALRLAREALDNHNGNYKLTKAEAQHIDRVIAAIDDALKGKQ